MNSSCYLRLCIKELLKDRTGLMMQRLLKANCHISSFLSHAFLFLLLEGLHFFFFLNLLLFVSSPLYTAIDLETVER